MLVFLLGTAFLEAAVAFVNLKDGSFHYPLKDHSLKLLDLEYSNRRNSIGHWGAGWCSALDLELHPGRGEIIEFKHCDRVQRFQKAKTSSLVKNESQFFESVDDSDVTIELANKQFFAHNRNSQRLYTFDVHGFLISIHEENTVALRVLSRSTAGLRVQIHGEILDLTFNKRRQVVSLKIGPTNTYTFQYDGARLMTISKPPTEPIKAISTTQFTYDSAENMTAYQTTGSPPIFIGYDRATDRVSTVQGRRECLEKFEYDQPEGPKSGPSVVSEVRLSSRAKLECATQHQLLSELQTRYLKTTSNELILIESTITTQELIRQMQFHPITGASTRETVTANPHSQNFVPTARPKTRLASE